MVDINRIISLAVKSGKIYIGSRLAINAARTGKAVAIVLATNCPSTIVANIKRYSETSKVRVYTYSSSSLNLGAACGKPFTVSALTIREITEPDVIKMLKEQSENIVNQNKR